MNPANLNCLPSFTQLTSSSPLRPPLSHTFDGKKRQLHTVDDFRQIDPRVRDVERLAEQMYQKQKASEQAYQERKQREEIVAAKRDLSNRLQMDLLDMEETEMKAANTSSNTRQTFADVLGRDFYAKSYEQQKQQKRQTTKKPERMSFRSKRNTSEERQKSFTSELILTRIMGNEQQLDEQFDPSKLLIQARYLISRNLLAEAELMLIGLQSKTPFHADCLFLLGETKRLQNKFADGQRVFERCMAQCNNYTPQLLKSLAMIHFQQSKSVEALFYLKQYLQFETRDDEAISLKGRIHFAQQEMLEASNCLNIAIDIAPQKLEYYLDRSLVNENLGLVELARRDYIYFGKHKEDYIVLLQIQVEQQRKNGKIQDSLKTQTLIEQLKKH